jgi:transposase-like protein
MGRPASVYSKVADVFGVSRQAVYKWRDQGAPFNSTDALLRWLGNQWYIRCTANFNLRSAILWEEVHTALRRQRRPPRKRVNGALQPRR